MYSTYKKHCIYNTYKNVKKNKTLHNILHIKISYNNTNINFHEILTLSL